LNEGIENQKPKILILGSGGFLGKYFSKYSNTLGIARAGRQSDNSIDFSNKGQLKLLEQLVAKYEPKIILNCLALTSISECENNLLQARLVNSVVPTFIAKLTNNSNISFVHFSTDAVFNGKNSPYKEDDLPTPISQYGITKLEGEVGVLNENPRALVLRTNFFGYSFKRLSLFNFFYQNLKLARPCDGYSDVVFSPMYVKDLCNATFTLLEESCSGLYHVVGSESLTKFEFGRRIAVAMKAQESLVVATSRPRGKANDVRSFDLRLDNNKMKLSFNPKYSVSDGILDSISEAQKEQSDDFKH
jgi:dTDP-4-dehydrorhamnose reductase